VVQHSTTLNPPGVGGAGALGGLQGASQRAELLIDGSQCGGGAGAGAASSSDARPPIPTARMRAAGVEVGGSADSPPFLHYVELKAQHAQRVHKGSRGRKPNN
jgi:hypothetical protein